MNSRKFLSNLSQSILSNFLVLSVSILTNIIVPRYLGLSEFSYWQLYAFYTSYIAIFHLGWLDGLYLRYAGMELNELAREKLGNQFLFLFGVECFFSASILLVGWALHLQGPRWDVLVFITAALIIINLFGFFLTLFQTTNQIKFYAIAVRYERIFYSILLIAYLISGGRSFKTLILFDLFAKLVVLVILIVKFKFLLNRSSMATKTVIQTFGETAVIGVPLVLANLVSGLIIGVPRFLLNISWSIEVFGKFSFTISILNMFMLFLNSIGIVIFPLVKKVTSQNLATLYRLIRKFLTPVSFFCLLFYFPAKFILNLWLPKYADSLFFLGILLPIIIFEARVTLLINPFLKSMRKEKLILKANSIGLLVSIIASYLAVVIWHNLILVNVVLVVAIVIRTLYLEISLSRQLQLDFSKDYLYEGCLVSLFIFSNIHTVLSLVILYAIGLVAYLCFTVKKSDLNEMIGLIRQGGTSKQ